jgi:hypothetical protein
MKYRYGKSRRAALLAAGLLGLLVVPDAPADRPPAGPAQAAPSEEPAPTREPAARLRIHVGQYRGEPASLRKTVGAWEKARPTRALLNRTPRIYQTEKRTLAAPPRLEVRALRCADRMVLRLVWDDATKDAPAVRARKRGDGAAPRRPYDRSPATTSAFADAAAVMVPQRRRRDSFPSLVMGNNEAPVRLYYWNASRGAEELTASGRARVERTGKAFPAAARHHAGKWTVTLELPDCPAGTPVAFAVWDGHAGDRDGLKCFSVWYVLE